MSARSASEIKAVWDGFGPTWERRIEPTTALLARTLCAHLRLSDANALLELGAGAGGAALVAQETLAPDARHVVTDISTVMLERARARLPGQVEVRQANVEELPFSTGEFDRVIMNLTLMLVEEPMRALEETARVLRPRGLAAWSVWGRPECSPLFMLPAMAAARAGMRPRGGSRSYFHLGQRDKLRRLLIDHGFSEVRTWYQPLIPPLPTAESFLEFVFGTPGWQTALEDESPRIRTAVRDELLTLHDALRMRGESVCLDVLVAVATRAEG